MAYGALELKPWEFENLQPHEFYSLLEGYIWRKEQKEDLFAYFVSRLMNIEGKYLTTPVTPAELLKPIRGEKETDKNATVEYLQDRFKDVLNGGE